MFGKIKISIFLKLILTVIGVLVLLDLGILSVLNYVNDSKPRKIFPHYVRRMERMLVNDIGFPPDTLKAQNVADDLEMEIRFQSENFNWTTSPSVPTLEELESSPEFGERIKKRPNIRPGIPPEIEEEFEPPPGPREHYGLKYLGSRYSVVKSPAGVYILQQPLPIDFFNPQLAVLLLICVVSVIIILLYAVLRWIFRPLKKLSAAVNEIGSGNYDVNVPVTGKDELGELAVSLNNMASSVKRSIKSKEQLLIDVSHELRSPLTRIKLGLEVDSPKERINEDVKEMEKMIAGLLENYRADSDHFKPKIEKVNLLQLVDEALNEYDGNERIMLGLQDEKELLINTDFEKLKLVIRNVIDNALKYSGGVVDVNISQDKNNYVLSVVDHGTGIPENDLQYIFEPFYRSDPSRSRRTGGFGLGLSICKKIMDTLGGKIEIKSKVNEGTTVFLILPK